MGKLGIWGNLLVKLFIFSKKVLKTKKNGPEVFLFIIRKLLSGCHSTMYVIAQLTHEDCDLELAGWAL